MQTEAPLLLTAKQLAEQLQVSERTVATWIAQKTIPFHRVGRLVRFDLQEVLETTKHTPRKF